MAKKIRITGKGPSGGFPDVKKALRLQPITVARTIASRVSPSLTSLSQASYREAQTVYGRPRPRGEGGKVLSLVKTGATLRDTKFIAIGTETMCRLGTPYAKYLIGKYTILPNGSAAIPVPWLRLIRRTSDDVVTAHNARPL